MKKFGLIILLSFSLFASAQVANITLDTNHIRIGEQTVLKIQFVYPDTSHKAMVIWPEFDEQLTDDIEIVKKTVDQATLIDSIREIYVRQQALLITAFEPGNFQILPLEIRLGDSLYMTDTLNLLVETVELDTAKAIYDIKPIYGIDYPLEEQAKDWIVTYWYWIVIPLLILAIILLYLYFKKRQPEKEIVYIEEVIPAHILALKALLELKDKEAWKTSEKKKYYSELTDTVRLYLENRFDIHAMEKTTREIITDLKLANISEDDKYYLRKILREADMVKFAKFNPSDDEAFAYLNKSIDFVERTKTVEKND